MRTGGRTVAALKESFLSQTYGPTAASILLLSFFSAGENIRLFGKWIINVELLYQPFYSLLSSFRSNGRFVWAAFYAVILVLALYRPKSKLLSKWYGAFITIVITLQLVDIYPISPESSLKREATDISNIVEAVEAMELTAIKKINIVPPESSDNHCKGYKSTRLFLPFNIYASQHNIRINSGFRSHLPEDQFEKYCKTSISEVIDNRLEKGTLYIIREPLIKSLPPSILKDCQMNEAFIARSRT